MHTLDFTQGLADIVRELKAREIVSMLQGWIKTPPTGNANLQDAQKDQISELLLLSLAGFERLVREEITGPILRRLSIADFYEPGRFRRFLSALTNMNNTSQINGTPEMWTYYEKFLSLVKIEETAADLLAHPKLRVTEPNNCILELEMIEYTEGIEPNRLAEAARAIFDLHNDIARLLGTADSKLTFRYLDTGSDLIMALEGAKAILEMLKSLFGSFFNRVVITRHERFDKDIEAMSNSLGLADKIQESVARGSVTEEEPKTYKTLLFHRVNELFDLGVSLPVNPSGLTIDERQLLLERREIKLLGDGSANKSNAGGE